MLVVDASGYSGGDNLFAISLQNDWADNNEFDFTAEEVVDGSLSDLDSDTNEIQAEFTFTPLTEGTHTIRIWTAADNGLATSLDVTVSVTVVDVLPPTIDSPPDMEISLGDISATLTWTPSDASPDRYEVYDGPTLFDSGGWDGSAITVQLSTLTIGGHDLTITVYDVDNRFVSDTVHVSVVDDAPPSIDGPGDMQVSFGTTGNNITWDPSDPTPISYEIFKDEISIKTGTWNSTLETITIDIDGLAIGEYNYTLLVTDDSALTATDTVIVTVDDFTVPTVNSPSDITYYEGDTGYSFTWNPVDDYPVDYTLWLNDAINRTGSWNSTGESITVDADGYPVEYHNFTIVFTDIGGNTVIDTVFVRVNHATLPTLDHPPDQYITELSTGNTIIWHPHDGQMGTRSYTIYKNGDVDKTGFWSGAVSSISANIDDLGLGSYNYTCEIRDSAGNYANDTVWVHVYDGTPPEVSDTSDIVYAEGDLNSHIINWNGTDLHPDEYAIYLNEELLTSGDWNDSAEVISIDAGLLPYGTYVFIIELSDIGNNEASDSVTVTVTDETPPSISDQVNVQINEGEDTILTWTGTDLHPASYAIYLGDVIVKSGSWNSTGEDITIAATGLSVGEYNYTAVFTDVSSNSDSDSANVTVVDSVDPTVNSPADLSYRQGINGNHINWTGSDSNPATYMVNIDGVLAVSGQWNSSLEIITVSVDGMGDGVHTANITLYDASSNSVSDSVTVTVTDGTAPRITQPENVTYIERKVGNWFSWLTTEAHPSDYVVYLDNDILTSGALNDTSETITLFIDGLSVGMHNYTLLVTDVAGNSDTSTVWVTVIENTNPLPTTTTPGSTDPTNSTSTNDVPVPGYPADLPMHILIIVLSYIGCIVGAIVLIEVFRRRYS